MSNVVSLIADTRQIFGKGSARKLRVNGQIPGVIYGKNENTVHVKLSERELTKLYNKGSYSTSIIDIDVNGQKYHVIPRGVELHPVTDKIEHADFMYITEDSKIKVSIHIHFINEDKCIGIKRGGVLNIVKRDIELFCSPKDIPSRIDVDVLNLDIGQNIHSKDLSLPEGAIIVGGEQNFTIATIVGRGGKEEAKEEPQTETKK